jgi:hypothetical protein
MRSTRAVAAVERLKSRSANAGYAMILSGGLFHLGLRSEGGGTQKLCDPLPLDAFVKFVDGYGPPKPRKVSKLDEAFEKQLVRKPSASD